MAKSAGASHKAAAQTRARGPVPAGPPHSEGASAPAANRTVGWGTMNQNGNPARGVSNPAGIPTANGRPSFMWGGAPLNAPAFAAAKAAASQAPAQQPAPPPAAASIVQPFLTPDQQGALSRWNATYGSDLANLDQSDKDAGAAYTAAYGRDQLTNAQDTNMTNQSMSARGLGFSSIRDNALNDLSVTLAQQQNILQTTRDATIFKDQTQRTALSGQNDATQTQYSGDAVANAQAITPVLPPPAPAAAANPVTPAPPAQPAAPPPVPAGPPQSEGVTTHPNPAPAANRTVGWGTMNQNGNPAFGKAARVRAGAGSPSGGAGLRGI